MLATVRIVLLCVLTILIAGALLLGLRRHDMPLSSDPFWFVSVLVLTFSVGYILWFIWHLIKADAHKKLQRTRYAGAFHWYLGWLQLGLLVLMASIYLYEPPAEYYSQEYDSIFIAAVSAELEARRTRQSEGEVVYLREGENHDVPDDVIKILRSHFQDISIMQWSLRSIDTGSCNDFLFSCGEANYISIERISFPFWRFAHVNVDTPACHRRHSLFKPLGRWIVISRGDLVCT